MARPLRLEFPDAVYHMTNCGNARQDIFLDDEDREAFLTVLGSLVQQQGWLCHAFCLMDNHYHCPAPRGPFGLKKREVIDLQSFKGRIGG